MSGVLLLTLSTLHRRTSLPYHVPEPKPEHTHLPHPTTPDIYQICSKRSFDGQARLGTPPLMHGTFASWHLSCKALHPHHVCEVLWHMCSVEALATPLAFMSSFLSWRLLSEVIHFHTMLMLVRMCSGEALATRPAQVGPRSGRG